MAASDPQGEMSYWINGAPFGGVQKAGNDMGEFQFWINGAPGQFIFPTGAAPTFNPGRAAGATQTITGSTT